MVLEIFYRDLNPSTKIIVNNAVGSSIVKLHYLVDFRLVGEVSKKYLWWHTPDDNAPKTSSTTSVGTNKQRK